MNGAIACHQCSSSGNVPEAKIIARKVAEKGNRQQRGCSLSRKWSHTRSRCKCRTHVAISVALPDNGRRLQAKSAAIAVQASSGQQRHRRHQNGWRDKPGTGVLPRCIFNLTMNEMLRKTKSKLTDEGDMLCSLLQLARRLIKHELENSTLNLPATTTNTL